MTDVILFPSEVASASSVVPAESFLLQFRAIVDTVGVGNKPSKRAKMLVKSLALCLRLPGPFLPVLSSCLSWPDESRLRLILHLLCRINPQNVDQKSLLQSSRTVLPLLESKIPYVKALVIEVLGSLFSCTGQDSLVNPVRKEIVSLANSLRIDNLSKKTMKSSLMSRERSVELASALTYVSDIIETKLWEPYFDNIMTACTGYEPFVARFAVHALLWMTKKFDSIPEKLFPYISNSSIPSPKGNTPQMDRTKRLQYVVTNSVEGSQSFNLEEPLAQLKFVRLCGYIVQLEPSDSNEEVRSECLKFLLNCCDHADGAVLCAAVCLLAECGYVCFSVSETENLMEQIVAKLMFLYSYRKRPYTLRVLRTLCVISKSYFMSINDEDMEETSVEEHPLHDAIRVVDESMDSPCSSVRMAAICTKWWLVQGDEEYNLLFSLICRGITSDESGWNSTQITEIMCALQQRAAIDGTAIVWAIRVFQRIIGEIPEKADPSVVIDLFDTMRENGEKPSLMQLILEALDLPSKCVQSHKGQLKRVVLWYLGEYGADIAGVMNSTSSSGDVSNPVMNSILLRLEQGAFFGSIEDRILCATALGKISVSCHDPLRIQTAEVLRDLSKRVDLQVRSTIEPFLLVLEQIFKLLHVFKEVRDNNVDKNRLSRFCSLYDATMRQMRFLCNVPSDYLLFGTLSLDVLDRAKAAQNEMVREVSKYNPSAEL